MAYQSTWYFSDLPAGVVDLVEKELSKSESEDSLKIPDTHWLCGFIWNYILRANRENFLYDLGHIDTNSLEIRNYNVGDYKSWYSDATPVDGDEDICKISFIVQLSDVRDYDGGNEQFMDENGNKYLIPRKRGTVVLYDSRAQHRVEKVTKGTRKSLVGWCVGPQWN